MSSLSPNLFEENFSRPSSYNQGKRHEIEDQLLREINANMLQPNGTPAQRTAYRNRISALIEEKFSDLTIGVKDDIFRTIERSINKTLSMVRLGYTLQNLISGALPPGATSTAAGQEASRAATIGPIIDAINAGEEVRYIYNNLIIPSTGVQPAIRVTLSTIDKIREKRVTKNANGKNVTSYYTITPSTYTQILGTVNGSVPKKNMATPEELIPGSLDLTFFEMEGGSYSFNSEIETHVKDTYEITAPVTSIPIYFIVITRGGHATLFIYLNGMMYSLGLGLSGEHSQVIPGAASSAAASNEHVSLPRSAPEYLPGSVMGASMMANSSNPNQYSRAVFFSPDSLLRTEQDSFLVDFGFFKKGHLNRIKEYLKKVPTPKKTIIFYKRNQFSSFYIDLDLDYYYISNPLITQLRKNHVNCTSFIQDIFRERVNCGVAGGIAVDPRRCRSLVIKGDKLVLFKNLLKGLNDIPHGADIFTPLNANPPGRTWTNTFRSIGSFVTAPVRAVTGCVGRCPLRNKTEGGAKKRKNRNAKRKTRKLKKTKSSR